MACKINKWREKNYITLLAPSLFLGTWSFIKAIYLVNSLYKTKKRESKDNLEHFSKKLKVVSLYSIKTILSHLNTKSRLL